MPIEEEWNDSAAPEPKSQDEIRTAITRLEKLISKTTPEVAKGLQEELTKLKGKVK
jgi:hypothetical protein